MKAHSIIFHSKSPVPYNIADVRLHAKRADLTEVIGGGLEKNILGLGRGCSIPSPIG